MLVLKNKNTGEYVNCFQSNADEKTLLYNAGLMGIKDLENCETIELTVSEYNAAIISYFNKYPPEKKSVEKVVCPNCATIFDPSTADKITN